MRIVVAVYRDNSRVHCSTLGAKTHSVLATLAEKPDFFENVARWLTATFEDADFPIENAQCEAKLIRIEDEKLEYELIFRKKRPENTRVILPGAAVSEDNRFNVKRDIHGNVDHRVPPPERTSDDSAN